MLHALRSGGRTLWLVPLAAVALALATAPLPAQILLTKTVGTTPGVCASDGEITVPVGTTVYFCYRVQNLSPDLLLRHNLDDDLLGDFALDFHYLSIPNGAIGQVILPWVATTSAVSESSWTAYHFSESWNGCANQEIELSAPGPGSPYPSTLLVDMANPLGVLDVQVDLLDVSHGYADDLDLLLVSPSPGSLPSLVLLSDVGGFQGLSLVDLRLEERPFLTPLPDGPGVAIVSGSYLPTDYGTGDTFPAPAPTGVPAPPAGSGRLVPGPVPTGNPDGTWSLYAIDDSSGFSGSIANWCLTIRVGDLSSSASATAAVSVTGPALAVEPGSIALRAVAGGSGSEPFAVVNDGSEPLDWQVGEADAFLPYSLSGGPVFYGDRATFDAAHPGLPIEDFEDTEVEGSQLVCRAPLDTRTSSACVAPGAIASGLVLRDDPLNEAGGGLEYGLMLWPEGVLDSASDFLPCRDDFDALELVFAPPVPAFGVDLIRVNGAGPIDLELFDAEGELIAATTATGGSPATGGSFWGASSEIPIARLRIVDPDLLSQVGVDDVAFGTVCDDPEEIAWLSVSPLSGTAPASGSSPVEATVDAAALTPGLYAASLCVDGNALNTPRVVVPVSAEVLPVAIFADGFESGDPFAWDFVSP